MRGGGFALFGGDFDGNLSNPKNQSLTADPN
jgi:hypothetical protein